MSDLASLVHHIGVGAGKFLWVRKIFARKVFGQLFVWVFPSTHIMFGMISKKRSSCMWFFPCPTLGRSFIKIKRWAPILIIFSDSLPRISGVLQTFSKILPRFSQILPGFSGILSGFLTNQNFWGCACNPCTPASYTSGSSGAGSPAGVLNMKLAYICSCICREIRLPLDQRIFWSNCFEKIFYGLPRQSSHISYCIEAW